MSYTHIIVSLKVLYIATLLSLFTYHFGLQSFILYSEHRVMFTDEMVDFRQDKPPAILITHTPIEPKNVDIISSCVEENKQNEEKGYARAVKCIDKNLKNKTEIFNLNETDNATQVYLSDHTTVKIGICMYMYIVYLNM